MRKFALKSVSLTLIFTLLFELVLPLRALALTTGPTQPEVHGFEPVGTTEMVDLFTGDFVYNIPLLDIDGYPINLSYHSGVGVEDEASWVGLGWSLNPGEINRTVRGLPDDFNGDKINKSLNISAETNYMGNVGVEVSAEILGLDLKKMGVNLGLNFSTYLNASNYKGLNAGVRAGVSASLGIPSSGNMAGSVGFSPSIGVGSQSGVDIDASLSFSLSNRDKANPENAYSSASIGVGSGINSRSGMKSINLSASYSLNTDRYNASGDYLKTSSISSTSSSTIPVGIQNYVPVITNPTFISSYYIQLKAGFEIYGLYPTFLTGVSVSRMAYGVDGSRKAYGYMYLENQKDRTGIQDFIRDKDGAYNQTMPNLPSASLAYDIFSVSGQGTGGVFRPFRNDIGTVYDPFTTSYNKNKSAAIELGFAPNLFEAGANITAASSEVTTGPWITSDFSGDRDETLYEKCFFKQAGELTYNNQAGTQVSPNNAVYSGVEPLNVEASYSGNVYSSNSNAQISYSNSSGSGQLGPSKLYNASQNGRTARANLIQVFTASKASQPGVVPSSLIPYYNSPGSPATPLTYSRLSDQKSGVSYEDRISAISQTLPDGRRYIYGIPAMNNRTREVTFGHVGNKTISPSAPTSGGLIEASVPTDNNGTPKPEEYYANSVTPGYAHAFLLTEVLSPDYVDIGGDGCTDDDLGGFVKLNYTLKSKDYRWRSPVSLKGANGTTIETAHFDPGFQSDPKDGKATVLMGSRQQWYVSTIESKNLIAEFYISARKDANGETETIDDSYTTNTSSDNKSFKLDSIRLFNKSYRYSQGNNAVPLKTILFDYDYSLCPSTPNSSSGKLTLKRLFIRYGNSGKNMSNPYVFTYNVIDGTNDKYNYEAKDRWGNRKAVNSNLSNFEFPYTDQTPGVATNTDPATAYNLKEIGLPSGGKIDIEYEADDYAYVQDKRAMMMVMIEGFGTGTSLSTAKKLYEGKSTQNNYVYFKRTSNDNLGANPSSSDILKYYLEGQKYLYYSVSVDIRGGAYEQIKGFAEINTSNVGVCTDDHDYCYVELKKINSSGINFNPVALYAMNFAKLNLNQILYPGYGTKSLLEVLKAFRSAADEIRHLRRPHQIFVERGYCKNVNLAKSWMRVQSPVLSKKGGGIRVKRIKLFDEWNNISGNAAQATATYGKEFDYTVYDPVYGRTISSGVASYEPLTGGDENPLRQPVPYTVAENLALPAIRSYQLEPLGETFYPGGVVGYSSVKVRSINIDKGKSSMSEVENLFYTAKDFPIRVEFTGKNGNNFEERTLFVTKKLVQASQGYSLIFNDMHGKPKSTNNYIVTKFENGEVKDRELISGITYVYQKDPQNNLSNSVMALVKENGQYAIRQMQLGQESDLTFDSRQNYDDNESIGADINLNLMIYGLVPVPIPIVFPSYNQQTTVFQSMVATKIVQQYGILKRIEAVNHGAKTTVENLVYDAESGNVLLSRTNNEFNDQEYTTKLPAYLAYEGMGSAYTNVGFKDAPARIYVNRLKEGFMETSHPEVYVPGDELLLTKPSGSTDKLWVLEKKKVGISEYYGYSQEANGHVAFFQSNSTAGIITIKNSSGISVVSNAMFQDVYTSPFDLTFSNYNTFSLSPGQYTVIFNNNGNCSPYAITVTAGQLQVFRVYKCDCSQIGDGGSGGEGGPDYCLQQVDGEQCLLKVAPRYVYSHNVNSSNSLNWWWNPASARWLTETMTEIIRSGKRNQLGQNVQEITSMQQPVYTDGSTLNDLLIHNKLISASASEFTDASMNFENYNKSSTSSASGVVNEGYNDYVLGLKGVFRPVATYSYQTNRNYANGHTRKDGLFNLSTFFWEVQYNIPEDCNSYRSYVYRNTSAPDYHLWKSAAQITKYDLFGNAVEEKNAIDIYSTAIYGFNRKVPVGVVTNAHQQEVMIEGFEDLNSILTPEGLRSMFFNFSGSASSYFTNILSDQFYLSAINVHTAGQTYYNITANSATNSNLVVQAGPSHTGRRYLKVNATTSIAVPVVSTFTPDGIKKFSLVASKRYLFSIWAKSNGSSAIPSITLTSGSSVAMTAKGKLIDGWQLFEGVFDLSSLSNPTSVTINFSGAVLIDDIRIIPADANAKSFVYDYENGRLMAQLDENNYATMYEYDLQGQLVRVKKETESGIITVSEGRKALKK